MYLIIVGYSIFYQIYFFIDLIKFGVQFGQKFLLIPNFFLFSPNFEILPPHDRNNFQGKYCTYNRKFLMVLSYWLKLFQTDLLFLLSLPVIKRNSWFTKKQKKHFLKISYWMTSFQWDSFFGTFVSEFNRHKAFKVCCIV